MGGTHSPAGEGMGGGGVPGTICVLCCDEKRNKVTIPDIVPQTLCDTTGTPPSGISKQKMSMHFCLVGFPTIFVALARTSTRYNFSFLI